VFRSILTFSQLLEMVLQVAQGIGDGWGGVRREQHLSWSRVIRGPVFVSREQLEGSCPLRKSGTLARRSNSAVRATKVNSRRFLRELDEAPEGNNLQYILKCPCILFFGNQGLHNEIILEGNGGHSGVMCEGSSYK